MLYTEVPFVIDCLDLLVDSNTVTIGGIICEQGKQCVPEYDNTE